MFVFRRQLFTHHQPKDSGAGAATEPAAAAAAAAAPCPSMPPLPTIQSPTHHQCRHATLALNTIPILFTHSCWTACSGWDCGVRCALIGRLPKPKLTLHALITMHPIRDGSSLQPLSGHESYPERPPATQFFVLPPLPFPLLQ